MDPGRQDPDDRWYRLDEPGFRGELRITDGADGRRVIVSGTRPDGEATLVQKEVPADRDERLLELVRRCLDGDAGAPAAVLAHVGVLDPS